MSDNNQPAHAKRGPKRKEVDIDKLEQLAALGLTQAEICLSIGISVDTLERRSRESEEYAEAIKRGRMKGAAVVASKLMERVRAGDLGAIIWYEKTRCGRTDRIDHTSGGERLAPTIREIIVAKRQRDEEDDGD